MLIIVRIMASITIKVASGPAPTTMGNGPTIITPPKLTEPPERATANVKIVMPMIIRIKPKKNKAKK